MQGIAEFLDTILGGIDLVAYCLLVGGFLWAVVLLRPWRTDAIKHAILLPPCIELIVRSAMGLFLIQVLAVAVKAWVIAETLHHSPFPEFAHTLQFKAGLIRALCLLGFAIFTAIQLRRQPTAKTNWMMALLLLLPVIISGAWLVHAAGRLEQRFLLMTTTVIHQLGAALWIGGVAQILTIWRLRGKDPIVRQLWPLMLTRFSVVGFTALAVILTSGIYTAWLYVGTIEGLLGTGYGNLLTVKICLLSMALGFAALNYRAARTTHHAQSNTAIMRRVPYYIQAEFLILVTILFTAAALSSQPPSIDIPDLTASYTEIIEVFKPKFPSVESPSHQRLLADEAGRKAIIAKSSSATAAAWSDYNHNVSGLFLFVMTLIGMLSYSGRVRWARYWPLGFVALAIFLFFRADAEAWPMGPLGFWESMSANSEILQHRIATCVALLLGVFEYRARKTNNRKSRTPYVFPILCSVGGLMLLTHSHVGFQAKTEFLIQVGHTMMGLLAIVVACGRLLELKLAPPAGKLAGFTSVFAIFLISLILMFYREPVV